MKKKHKRTFGFVIAFAALYELIYILLKATSIFTKPSPKFININGTDNKEKK